MPQHTPLHAEHLRLSAKMVEFAGWEMPVQYAGVIAEHLAVRNAAGLFDVSHMGQIEIAGRGAEALVQQLTTNDVKKMEDGRAQYSLLCNERGTVIDDVIVYRFSRERYLLVVNASNRAKDVAWCKGHERPDARAADVSRDFALVAFQGPKAKLVLQRLTDLRLDGIENYRFAEGSVAGVAKVIVARTGYTGEEGFELFLPPERAVAVWRALLDEGVKEGVQPAGLGARDTLRLEMKYSLYGHEITEETNPFEAGLGWVVKLETPDDFIGKAILIEARRRGPARKLVGFEMVDRGIPRRGYPIIIGRKAAGIVTSGTMSPSLGRAIGIGFVPAGYEAAGTNISIDIRGQAREATVVKTPFYRK